MFADDDYDFLESTQLMFMDLGFDIIPAVNGEEAIQKYKENKPDIVFLDIKMPGINGYETFFRIIKHDKDARVFFTSSYAIDNEQFQEAKQKSLRGIIKKPFELKEVQQMIDKYAK